MRIRRLGLVVILLALLILAAGRSVRLAWADFLYRTGTPDSIQSAINLEPGRALYHTGQGDLKAATDGDAGPSYRQAVKLKPNDAYIRMRLGLWAETAGDFAEAERQLLAAARVNRKYEPRWTLANYYFRRGDEEQFWHWAEEALRISFGDRTALFDLCWRMDPTGLRLGEVMPAIRPVQLAYANFLMSKQQWGPAEAILAAQAVTATGSETQRFLRAVSRLIAAGHIEGAVSVWNALIQSGTTSYPRLDRQRGPWITNASFSNPITGAGFDWRIHDQPGIYVSRRDPAGLRIELSGRQPGECEILDQYVALPAGAAFEIRYRFHLSASGFSEAPTQTGLVWRVMDMAGRRLSESDPIAADESGSGVATFRVPQGTECVRLVLAHHRVPGSVRMEGSLNLERVTLVLQIAISED